MVTTFRYSAKSQRDARLHRHHARLTGKTPNRSFKFKKEPARFCPSSDS